jgi:hypothetical protein
MIMKIVVDTIQKIFDNNGSQLLPATNGDVPNRR